MIIKKILIAILSFTLSFNDLVAAVSLESLPRNVDLGNDILNNSIPSDLPIAGYDEFFDREVFNVIENMNLSSYSGMKPFVGYGVYKESDASCQYIEVPGKSQIDFDRKFRNYYVFNDNSYGLSTDLMNYNECKNLATEFGGNVVSIDERAENLAIARFAKEQFWVGAKLNSCSDTDYTSSLNKTQFFYNWNISERPECDATKKNIKSSSRGIWNKTNDSQLLKCVVEWETTVYYRPLRVCAPWWKIIREYNTNTSTLYNQAELNSINQGDIPQAMSICLKFDTVAIEELADSPSKDVQCTSYYALSPQKPECTHNIKQEQCFVDECGGYIKDVCRLKDEEIVGKGYIKGEVILESGVLTEVKIKDDVKTHVFECPPSPPSNQFCEEKARVTVYPKECPDSQCYELRKCILELNPTQSKDDFKDAEKECRDTYKCEKVYPNPQLTPTIVNGVVTELQGICSDGSSVYIAPNILKREKKKCMEYEKHLVTDDISQRCILDKTYQDHTVNVAITEEDLYKDDPNCLRTDKVEDSQINELVTLRIKDNDFYKNRITKVFIDGETELLYDSDQLGNYFLKNYYGNIIENNSSSEFAVVPDQDVCDLNSVIDDDLLLYEDLDFFDRSRTILYNGSYENLIIDTEVEQINIDTLDVVINGTLTTLDSTRCSGIANEKGFSTWANGTPVYHENNLGITSCTVPIKGLPLQDDGLIYIKSESIDSILYNFSERSKHDCLIKALQLNGRFNENSFGSDWDSEAECVVTSGEMPNSYMDYLESLAGCVEEEVPESDGSSCPTGTETTNASTTINGLTSILVIEDYLDGAWGFSTNYTLKLPLENRVHLTSSDFSNIQVFPLNTISQITDYPKYISTIDHWSSMAKEPTATDYGLMAGGAAVAGLLVWFSVVTVGIGAAIAAVVILVVLLLVGSEKMNRQNIEWIIYKYVDHNYIGDYDLRYWFLTEKDIGEEIIPSNDSRYRIYIDGGYKTGRNKPKTFEKEIEGYKELKKETLRCLGFEMSVIAQTIHSSEKGVITPYPSCPWYKPSCTKTDTHQWFHNADISKPIKNSYIGGTQTLVMLLPYIGDFIFTAYDKHNNKLGEVLVSTNEFVNTTSAEMMQFARVSFGPGMNLSSDVSNRCLRDNMVEWGGGVSGGYFENENTANNTNCSKSNDDYVKEHSMTKIEVRPTTMLDQAFVFELTKPLPYANRIFAATLDKKQKRNYRCFDEFVPCDDSNFKGGE